MSAPLNGLRIVTTIPPHPWFGGIDYNFAIEMTEELRVLGATVFELHIGSFITSNDIYIRDVIQALRAFRPDVAIALPNALYALLCRDAQQNNIFKDILQIPTIMLWDHGLLQLPQQILGPLPNSPAEASGGCIRRLKRALNHPLYVHYSPDRGHIEALDKLGVMDRRKVRFFLQPAYPNYVRYGYRAAPANAYRTRVAFAGNVYVKGAQALAFRNEPGLAEIEARVLAAKKSRLTDCLWDLITAEIGRLDEASRKRLRLEPNYSFFWQFMHEEIETVGNTEARLGVLTALKREFDFFGNFVEPDSVSTLRERYHMKFRKCLDYFTELPLLFMNSDVIVDVVNLGYNTGVSPKIMGCFACGGLILFDYKSDFHEGMGELGNQVMYRSLDQLNAMVEEYLSNPKKRREVSRYLQHRVATEFNFAALSKKVLIDEPAWRNGA
ncbi:MAG TPA: glycosyltransferase [Bryobacteraceae bacterium]|nr:glycosyltransferase [Bryobacteraceae bacterium]